MGDHDLAIVANIVIFVSCLSFLSLLLPAAYQFITVASLGWFSGAVIAVAGVCVVATGIPCAAAIGIYAVTTFLATYFTTTFTWIATLILTPISIILIVFIAKLARGQ